MTDAAEKLKPVIATLSAEDRAELIEYLVSFDIEEELAEQEWSSEVNRRVAEIRSGRAKMVPGEEVMKRLREKYG